MPSYDFRCRACGHTFTKRLSISAKKEAVCEKCNSSELEQLFRSCFVTGGKGKSCSQTSSCVSCKGCH